MSNIQFNSITKSWDIIASRIYSSINANLTLESSATANLLVKTNGNVLVTADLTGNVIFPSPPICSVLPVVPAHLINKQYADSLLIGPQGPQGFQGFQGAQGAQGFVGTQGASGAQGAIGDQGLQGAVGTTGTPGSVGLTGSQGPAGANGGQGAQGFQGSTGNQGAQGFTGADGGEGAQGFQGATGGQGGTGGPTSFLNTDTNVSTSLVGSQATINLVPPLLNIVNVSTAGLNISSGYLQMNNNGNASKFYFNGNADNFYYDSASTFAMTKPLSVPIYKNGPISPPIPSGYIAKGTAAGIALYTDSFSSLRFKTNIDPLIDNDDILNVQPVSFNYKDASGNPMEEKYIGFIAEEMAKNELGNYFVVRNEDNSCETIDYELLIPLYASSIRVLKVKITTFSTELEAFKEDQNVQHNNLLQRITDLQNFAKK